MNGQELARGQIRWRLSLVLIVAAAMAALVIGHVKWINGPWYHVWPWRRLSLWVYPAMLAAAIPFFIGQWLYARGHGAAKALALVMASTLCLQIAAICVQPLGFNRIAAIVQNWTNTSYYNAAKVLTEQMDQGASYRDWIEIYPQLMPRLMLHAGYKPPGLIFYYILMIRIFGEGYAAATAGGLLLALLACAGMGATYRLIRTLGLDEAAAFYGAAYFALIPSLVLFFPQFDQAYPLLVCLLLILWIGALRSGGRLRAMGFGLLLAFVLLLTPMFLMLGAFMGIYALLHIGDRRSAGLVRAIELAAWSLPMLVAVFTILWLAFGYDPIQTFTTAARMSQAHLVALQRPWPLHSFFDLVDIALGIGWMSVPLLVMGTIWLWRRREIHGAETPSRLVTLGLVQVLLAVAVAVFPGENARLMLPMMPLLMAPIGAELSRWNWRARSAVYLVLVLISAVIVQNMIGLYMGPEIEGVPRQ
jgi:hypothetical protein